ncbi:flavoprotein [Streptomyces sp. NPDC049881]|uniref:flavoprotein n=1 Tax=Streptomyces sp. NPDC049881 TaxID=3155778 RepID=UPI003425E211
MSSGVLYLIACAAGPTRFLDRGIARARADAMLVAPLTTTSACKWAAGITDTLALGLPAEGVHLGIPVTAAPFWNTALGAQPAVERALDNLRAQGVHVVHGPGEPHTPKQGDATAFWDTALHTLT